MRTLFPVIAIATAGAGGLPFACGMDTTTNRNVPMNDDAGDSVPDSAARSADGGASAAGADDGAVDSGDAATVAPQAYVRIAHWSPNTPAVDVCFNQAGASWAGRTPQLAQIAAARDAGPAEAGSPSDSGVAGIVFPQVTSYLAIPPDTYEVRLVDAGAADCVASVVDLASVTLAANSYTTIASVGEVAPVVGTDEPLALAAFTDEVSAPAGQIAIRFLNASPSPGQTPANLGTGSLAGGGGPYAALFSGVPFGRPAAAGSDAGSVDANGYVASTPLATATLSAHQTGRLADTTVALNDVTIPGMSATTVALVNGVSNGMASSAAKLLQCAHADDSTGTSLLTTCLVVSTP